jgi:ParB-like chromosome segregation protein Spo0J
VAHRDNTSWTMVAIGSLRPGPSPRREINLANVAALAELDGGWDPILVQRQTLAVIDGRHRLAAASRLGHRAIKAVYFDGTDAEARVESVRLNVRHGMPLTLGERAAAARQLIAMLPEWSDRQLGSVCALSPRTIARLRSEVQPVRKLVVARSAPAEKRVGKDGRQYPVAASVQRDEIRRVLEEDPGASLRSVAARIGASPETVRTVRKSMEASAERAPVAAGLHALPTRHDREPEAVQWTEDSACASTEEGRTFAQWFDEHAIDDDLLSALTTAVPLSRVYGVIDEARHRAEFWESFAKSLQGRVCRRR